LLSLLRVCWLRRCTREVDLYLYIEILVYDSEVLLICVSSFNESWSGGQPQAAGVIECLSRSRA
jgi:hypothetical protein